MWKRDSLRLLARESLGARPIPTPSLDMAVYLGPYVPPLTHSRSTYLLSSPSVQIDPTANYTAAIMLKLKDGGEDALRHGPVHARGAHHMPVELRPIESARAVGVKLAEDALRALRLCLHRAGLC